MKIILASGSPRRKELLSQIGLEYTVEVSHVSEKTLAETPALYVRELAAKKAKEVYERCGLDNGSGGCEPVLVIGADTVVSCGGQILGKPADEEEAFRMLKLLSGRSHEVFTGVCLLVSFPGTSETEEISFEECTRVFFYKMSDDDIREYIAAGECYDKAGAYGIQGLCARYIEKIEGDYNNVVGLPVGHLFQEIKKLYNHS